MAINAVAPRRLEEWVHAHETQAMPSPFPQTLSWQPPSSHELNINIDCALLPHERIVGGGMVLRNHMGALIRILAIPFAGIYDPFVGETKTLLCAMEWALQNGSSEMIFETDCAILATAMNTASNSYAWELIHAALCLKEQFSKICFLRVRRQGNRVADGVARFATRLSTRREWLLGFPQQVATLAQEDLNGERS